MSYLLSDTYDILQATTSFRAANGTAAIPSFSFISDTDVGFFRISANVLGVATAGAEVARFTTVAMTIGGVAPPTGHHFHVRGPSSATATGSIYSAAAADPVQFLLRTNAGSGATPLYLFADDSDGSGDGFGLGANAGGLYLDALNPLALRSASVVRVYSGGSTLALEFDASQRLTSTTQPRAKINLGTGITIANNSFTAIAFDTSDFNVGSVWASASATRFLAAAAGLYLVHGRCQFTLNTTGQRGIRVRRNAASVVGVGGNVDSPASATVINLEVSCLASATVNDYFEVEVFQDSGATLSITSGAGVTEGTLVKLW